MTAGAAQGGGGGGIGRVAWIGILVGVITFCVLVVGYAFYRLCWLEDRRGRAATRKRGKGGDGGLSTSPSKNPLRRVLDLISSPTSRTSSDGSFPHQNHGSCADGIGDRSYVDTDVDSQSSSLPPPPPSKFSLFGMTDSYGNPFVPPCPSTPPTTALEEEGDGSITEPTEASACEPNLAKETSTSLYGAAGLDEYGAPLLPTTAGMEGPDGSVDCPGEASLCEPSLARPYDSEDDASTLLTAGTGVGSSALGGGGGGASSLAATSARGLVSSLLRRNGGSSGRARGKSGHMSQAAAAAAAATIDDEPRASSSSLADEAGDYCALRGLVSPERGGTGNERFSRTYTNPNDTSMNSASPDNMPVDSTSATMA